MVGSQLAVAADLRSANGTNTFYIPVVVLDAALAELMQTLTNVLRVIVNCGAYLAEQGLVLDALEQVRGYNRVVGFVQFAGPGHYV